MGKLLAIMSKRNLIITALAVFVLISGCRESESGSTATSVDKLLSAPEEIELRNGKYTLETYLWRDFMPISPPDGKPLIALIRITAADSREFPLSIDANRLWVINDREVWETGFSKEKIRRQPQRKHQLEKIARNGPKWGPGIRVDVVVRIIDRENNTYLLRASDQRIHRTD